MWRWQTRTSSPSSAATVRRTQTDWAEGCPFVARWNVLICLTMWDLLNLSGSLWRERPIRTKSRQNEREFRTIGKRDFVLIGNRSDLEFVLTGFCFATGFTCGAYCVSCTVHRICTVYFLNVYYAVVTCEIKIFWNNFEIISVFYVWNYFKIISVAEIISELFQRRWTCWKIFMSCNKPLKAMTAASTREASGHNIYQRLMAQRW